jgi:transposase
MIVEAAWSASRAPGPLRAFYQRIAARRGFQVAVVATAREMTVLCWHLVTKDQDYAFARPGLNAHKRRKLELAAGAPRAHGQRGPGFDYNDRGFRRRERDLVEHHERAYEVMIAHWQPKRPAASR